MSILYLTLLNPMVLLVLDLIEFTIPHYQNGMNESDGSVGFVCQPRNLTTLLYQNLYSLH